MKPYAAIAIALLFTAGNTAVASSSPAAFASYAFQPERLESIRADATARVLAQLDSLSPQQLERDARAYFESSGSAAGLGTPPSDVAGADLENMVLAYRAEMVINTVYHALKNAYPREIVDAPLWVWNNVGGVFARMAILSCSVSEYLAVWGADLPQAGFSGYYPEMEVYDIMMLGKMRSYGLRSRQSNPVIYTPGGRISVLKKRETRQYNFDSYTYMMDYGRGTIPAAFWQGIIAPYIFTSHDWDSLFGQLQPCAEQIFSRSYGEAER